ncbi:hypothetical protein H5410_001132 [Solanum commersonii]|uniref:Uncharacterized protein n=1 Tax=Solanum commersonii TaxID=4109 RepID=A0A9J6AZ97_SOLCO|nr:hypothetical protein H5410_001132 [Solanum commersonii]
MCVTVFVKDCELFYRNIQEEWVGRCGLDGGDTIDTQAMMLSVPFVSDVINCDIISNTNQKEVMVHQVYKDKKTLKGAMKQYAIDHKFQWKTNISNQIKIKKFLNDHTFPLKDQVYCQRQATSNVGGIIQTKLVNHKKKLTPKDIQDGFRRDLGVDITYAVT